MRRTPRRVQLTKDALVSIARHVAGYPGRKNLLWISTAFPVYLVDPTGDMSRNHDYEKDIQSISAALSDARIAVYTMNPAGVLAPSRYDAEEDLPMVSVKRENAESNEPNEYVALGGIAGEIRPAAHGLRWWPQVRKGPARGDGSAKRQNRLGFCEDRQPGDCFDSNFDSWTKDLTNQAVSLAHRARGPTSRLKLDCQGPSVSYRPLRNKSTLLGCVGKRSVVLAKQRWIIECDHEELEQRISE